jgi:biopolymer transport protein ExbD
MLNTKHTTRFLESKRRRQTMFRSAMDMSGLAAVLICLLWGLMASQGLFDGAHHYRFKTVDRLRAAHGTPRAAANRDDAVVIAVQRDGKIFLDLVQVGPDELSHKLVDQLRRDTVMRIHRPLFLDIDQRAHFGDVKPALEAVRNAGLEKVIFLTADLKPQPVAP